MSTTIREEASSARAAQETPEWALVVVHHNDPQMLGVRRVVIARAAVDLGRDSGAFGERSFDDPLISRKHARIELDGASRLQVCDLGSANGTWVNGARAAVTALDEGDVVRVGSVLLSVQRAPASYAISRSTRAPVVAWSTARFVERLRAALERRGVLLLRAPCEAAWRPYLARCVEDVVKTGGRLALSDAAASSVAADHVAVLRAPDAATLDALMAQREALVSRRATCIATIDDAVLSRSDGTTREHVLRFPSLSERVEDIPWLVRARLADALGSEPPALDHALSLRLLRGSWPEDIDGLNSWVRAVCARTSGAKSITPSDDDLRYTGEPRGAVSAPNEAGAEHAHPWTETSAEFVLSRHGSWFVARGERAVDLRTRYALARVLRALVAGFETNADATMSIDDLVDAGWPGEKLIGDSGTNRLYVAVGTLRKLGLRELIERREGGYRLSPHCKVEVAAQEVPPSGSGSL